MKELQTMPSKKDQLVKENLQCTKVKVYMKWSFFPATITIFYLEKE